MHEPRREDPYLRRERERYRYEMEMRARQAEERLMRDQIMSKVPPMPRW